MIWLQSIRSRRKDRWSQGAKLPLRCGLTVALCLATGASAQSQSGRTIGFVLTDWRHALYETAGVTEECPAGLQASEEEQNQATPGYAERLATFGFPLNRGPNGELSAYAPTIAEDPLPFSELKTKVGFGLNLDGTNDGAATAKTCKHEKFETPAGEHVDNQMARVLGCSLGWRTDGFNTEFAAREFASATTNRILVEVSGVDDELNDSRVEVTIYKGLDGLTTGGDGKFVPFTNQRIDDRFPRYMFRTRGKIVDGVLTSEPVPVANLPLFWVGQVGERRIRDLRLKLKLSETGAEGFVGGYEDIKTWWSNYSRGMVVHGGSVGKYSFPGLYRAAHRYADGYPDPKTGQCTAISAAYKVHAVRAIIPPSAKAQSIVAAAAGSGDTP